MVGMEARVAGSVVDGALKVATSIVAAEVAVQLHVNQDREFITDELRMMRTFLVASDEERSTEPVVREWARQARDVAYDVEDYIEDFTIHLGGESWWWLSPAKILIRRRIGVEMRKLRARVNEAGKRRLLYCSPTAAVQSARQEIVSVRSGSMQDLNISSGVELSNLLTRQDIDSLMVVSICVGTADELALVAVGRAYDELADTGRFSCRAWVSAQHPLNSTEFIRSLLRQFRAHAAGQNEQVVEGATTGDVHEAIETMGAAQLISSLAYKLVNKSYLFVISDISTREEWDNIKLYLPDFNEGSRIIITCQREDVAKYCAGGRRSRPFFFHSDNTNVHSAFCNMDIEADELDVVCEGDPENAGSTSSEIVEIGHNVESRMPTAIDQIVSDRIDATVVTAAERLVGREKEMDHLIVNVLGPRTDNNNNMFSVCGLMGIGKTALVRSAYDRQDVKAYFTNRAWISILHPMTEDELLYIVLQHFKSAHTTTFSRRPLKEMRMELEVFYEMNKNNESFKCLIVVDGVSSTTQWDNIKSSLLLMKYKAILRVIVTTRELQVANYCSNNDYDFVCNLRSLHEDDSAKLLRSKVYGTYDNVALPKDMLEEEKKILEKCGGIPFAIVRIGQHLASVPLEANQWGKCLKDFKLEQLAPDLGPMRTTMESVYDTFSYHVKYCFMYLSIFQEDLNIMRRRLLKRWIAEGYLNSMLGPEPEELGERVLNEFLSMTIMQPTKYAAITSGRVTSCSVHPLMLQLSTLKAKEEELVCMLDNNSRVIGAQHKIRHVVVRRSWGRDQKDAYKSMNLARVRSLTVFGEWEPFFLSPKMRMLRVLDLEGVEGLTGPELEHIGNFRHLKYLGLRSTYIKHLPKSLGKLKCLETLDIRYTYIRTVPSTVVNLKMLRVLRGGLRNVQVDNRLNDSEMLIMRSGCCCAPWKFPMVTHNSAGDTYGVDIPKEIGELRALNTLGTVSVRSQGRLVVQAMRMLTQLQKLSVTGITIENGPDLCSTLQYLTSLESLTVSSDDRDGLSMSLRAGSMLSSFVHLRVLKLYGQLPRLPEQSFNNLNYLLKLYLENTKLEESSVIMNGVSRLPTLTILLLLTDSIMVPTLTFRSDGFRDLVLLEFANLTGLRYLSFQAVGMPKLKTLQVGRCNNLEELSFGICAMPKLEILQIENCDGLRLLMFEGTTAKLPMLRNLQVGVCPNLQLLQFRDGDMPNLETLLIRRSNNLLIQFEVKAVAKLKMLHIHGCRILQWLPFGIEVGHDTVVSSSAIDREAMPILETIHIEDCHELHRLSFRSRAMPQLKTLQIGACNNLDNLSFEQEATPMLHTLRIYRCRRMTRTAVSGLQNLNLTSNVFE